MAVKLAVKVSGGEHVEAGVHGTDIDASVKGTELGVAVANGTRLTAVVGTQPRLGIGSGAVQVHPKGEVFHGPYEVTPTLPGFDVGTRGKFMERDMKVNPIPIAHVSNVAGGYTVNIG